MRAVASSLRLFRLSPGPTTRRSPNSECRGAEHEGLRISLWLGANLGTRSGVKVIKDARVKGTGLWTLGS